MPQVTVWNSVFNMPSSSVINPGSVFQTYNTSTGNTSYWAAPAWYASLGSTLANGMQAQSVATPQGLPSTAQVFQGGGLGYQPYNANTAFNETRPGVFASNYSQNPSAYPQVAPIEIPGQIWPKDIKATQELPKELAKTTPAGQRISSPSELSQYKESDLARTTGNEIYRRDINKEKAALAQFGALYGKMPSTPEDWRKLNDIAYKGAWATASNGLPKNSTITDADGSKIETDEAGIPNASQSSVWTQQLNLVMSEITKTRLEMAQKEKDLAQYQEDTAQWVQSVGEQLGRSAQLVGGEQGALEQRRATTELKLAKQAQTLQIKLQWLNEDKQYISQQIQQLSTNAQNNLKMVLASMAGSTTKWSDIPLKQRMQLQQLATDAGIPSDILGLSIDAMANSASLEQETAVNDYQYIPWTDNQPGWVFDKKTGKFIPYSSGNGSGVITDATGNSYDISSYATDPNHEVAVKSLLSNMGQFKTEEDINSYIKSVSPNSPITGKMVTTSAEKYGVSWEAMVAMMQQDSSLGTAGKGARTFNPGNVGNDDSGNLRNYGSWDKWVDAVANWLSNHRAETPTSATRNITPEWYDISKFTPEFYQTDYGQKVINNEQQYYTNFQSQQAIKDFLVVQNKAKSIDAIIQAGVGGPGDLAIVYEFMKALDPTSVVRESEYASAAKSGNIFAGAYAKFNGYLKEKGGILPDSVKSAFSDITNKKMEIGKQTYDQMRNYARKTAYEQWLNPDHVAPDLFINSGQTNNQPQWEDPAITNLLNSLPGASSSNTGSSNSGSSGSVWNWFRWLIWASPQKSISEKVQDLSNK